MHEEIIIEGPPLEDSIPVPLGTLFALLLEAHGENVLQVDAVTGQELRANELLDRAKRLANWLKRMGILKGDAVSISSENRLEFPVVVVAVFFVGGIMAPINHDYTTDELKRVLNLAQPKIIFCSPKCVEKFEKVRNDHRHIEHLVLFSDTERNDMHTFPRIIQAMTSETFELVAVKPEEAVAVILCSSGTTGLPKGVMITHANITTLVDVAKVILGDVVAADDVSVGLVPFFHSMGFMMMCMSLLGGRTVLVFPQFRSKLFLESIVKYKVTTIAAPPLIATFLLKHPSVSDYDLSTLRTLRCGAASMGQHTQEKVKEKFSLETVTQSYGMTETTLGVLMHPFNAQRMGSVGKVVPGMKAMVIDEHGKSLGPNREGELCFKGPLIMKGYVNDARATAEAIDRDGWLHTGDIGYYNEDGYFWIVDRLKELIKYKGFQVAPAELEALLLSHPTVLDAAVVGMPNEDVGELPVAYVVKNATSQIDAKELQDFVAARVSPQKQLRGGVLFTDAIPRNPTGKILRRLLRAQLTAKAHL